MKLSKKALKKIIAEELLEELQREPLQEGAGNVRVATGLMHLLKTYVPAVKQQEAYLLIQRLVPSLKDVDAEGLTIELNKRAKQTGVIK